MRNSALKKEVEVVLMGLAEAEAVKLFSNTYLALRLSFFNELDTYAGTKALNARDIIQGICLDPRISAQYNNPSFGLDEYTLPANAKQLLANHDQILWHAMSAIVESNRAREDYISERVLELAGVHEPDLSGDSMEERKVVIGVFRLPGKGMPNRVRRNPIAGVIERIKAKGASLIVYEPELEDIPSCFGCKVVNNLSRFKRQSAVIIANRYDACLDDVKDKTFTRDLFGRD